MSDYIHHEETYEHKNGLKYNVRWYVDYDFGSPLEEHDGQGVTERMEWNPTDEEQLEQHIIDNEDEPGEGLGIEEETRLRLMRVLCRASSRWDKGLYYDVLSSLHKAKTEWGITDHDKAVEAVEKDYAYLKGWYDDDWFWLTCSVAPLDEDGNPIEVDRDYCGGYESTLVDNPEERAYVEEAIEDCIHTIECMRKQQLHKGQLELAFA